MTPATSIGRAVVCLSYDVKPVQALQFVMAVEGARAFRCEAALDVAESTLLGIHFPDLRPTVGSDGAGRDSLMPPAVVRMVVCLNEELPAKRTPQPCAPVLT